MTRTFCATTSGNTDILMLAMIRFGDAAPNFVILQTDEHSFRTIRTYCEHLDEARPFS